MIVENINKIKGFFTLKNVSETFYTVNNFALATTENVAVKGIDTLSKWQINTDKAIKNGLAFNAQKQEVIFDALDSGKETVVKNYNKIAKRFSK